jgi:hypothetical protein
MKKLPLILVAIILIVIAILPIVGNKFMQDKVADEITLLSAHGLKVQKVQTQSSYLTTKKHFEFIVEDSSDILKVLDHYAKYRVPAYSSQLFNGFLIGVDVAYSNIPFAKSIDFDIYPLAMSPQMEKNMKAEDVKFYEQIAEFLLKKGLLYHVEYNLINSAFKGYVKDINEDYQLQNGSALKMKLLKATFKGEGELIDPKSIKSEIKELHFQASEGNTSVIANLQNFFALNEFASFSEYKTAAKVKKLSFIISGTEDDVTMNFNDFDTMSASSLTKGKVAAKSESSLESLELTSKKVSFALKKLSSKIAVSDVDAAAFEDFMTLLSTADDLNMLGRQRQTQEVLTKLLSKGFVINVDDLSLKDFILDKEDLGGFEIDAKVTIKEDADLAQKLQISPLLFLSNIELISKIKLDNGIYAKLLATSPMATTIDTYAKKEKDHVLFDLNFTNGAFHVNGKQIR